MWPFPDVKAWGKIVFVDQLLVFGKIRLFRAKPPTLQARAQLCPAAGSCN